MLDIRLHPFRLQKSPEPPISTEVLPKKILAPAFGSVEKDDRPVITDGEILDHIQAKFGDKTAEALKIMDCESGGNRYAVNWQDAEITGMPSLGLFQLNRVYDERYFDPLFNISEAYELYLRRGWNPWYNCKNKLGI